MAQPKLKTVAKHIANDPEGNPVIMREVDGELVHNVLYRAEEGKPIAGELVHCEQHSDDPTMYDVETIYDPKTDGPAMVNSLSFRTGWDRVFGKKAEVN